MCMHSHKYNVNVHVVWCHWVSLPQRGTIQFVDSYMYMYMYSTALQFRGICTQWTRLPDWAFHYILHVVMLLCISLSPHP